MLLASGPTEKKWSAVDGLAYGSASH